MRQYTFFDHFFIQANHALSVLATAFDSQRENPGAAWLKDSLNSHDSKVSAGLMRVNHSGEVCAQALYQSQLVFARSQDTRLMLKQAAQEEIDHLVWTHQRLVALQAHASYFNIFWYCNAFMMGLLVGCLGDGASLGFVEETERQVADHLGGHVHKLPSQDRASHEIVQQMRLDEQQHGYQASLAGGVDVPYALKIGMKLHAKVMTTWSYLF